MPAVVSDLANALGTKDPVRAIFELADRIGVPSSLRQLGLVEADLRPIAGEVVAKCVRNPRRVTLENISELLKGAWAGERSAVT